jgi:cytochrome c oxidase cbb3-type subunit 1
MYFFVPMLLRKPVWSHALSLIGFWGLAFFYPMQGVHHFLLSPIPMYAQYGAVVATIAVEIVVVTVIVNFFATLHGRSDAIRGNLALRWFYTGKVMYAITCFQCAFQVTLTFQKVIHFTDWVVGHAHMVMFGVFGFWIRGVFIELWPRVCGRPWEHPRLLTLHYWMTFIGLTLMVIHLTAAGLVQGFSWAGLSHWGESVVASMPFWWVRTVAGLVIVAGQGCFLYALWATARSPLAATVTVPEARAGSWEHVFHQASPQNKLLLLEGFDEVPGALDRRGHRAIGVVYRPEREAYGNYVPSVLPYRYDAMLYIDQTEALHPLHMTPVAEHEVPETYPTGM